MAKRIFIISAVRHPSTAYRKNLEKYVVALERVGNVVHLPHRDTDQTATSLEICTANMNAIKDSDEVHIFYSSTSQGTLFDMGVAFGLGKTIKVIETEPLTKSKSFANLLNEWAKR